MRSVPCAAHIGTPPPRTRADKYRVSGVARIVLCADRMMKAWLTTGFAMISICSAACGGATSGSDPASGGSDPSSTTSPGTQPGQSGDTSSATDEQPSSSDPCSILHPGSAKALPNGVVVPAAAPALRLTFTLANQRIEATAITARQVVPAWTTKETQIFSPDTTSGFWVETRDTAGTLSYQRNLHDPLGRRIEVAPDPNDPNEGWKNIERCTSTATFRVEIPGDAAEVRVYGSEKSGAATVLLAWYRLH